MEEEKEKIETFNKELVVMRYELEKHKTEVVKIEEWIEVFLEKQCGLLGTVDE